MKEKGEEETRILVRNLVKIFGSNPQKALHLLSEALSQEEIREKAGQLVALRDISFEVKSGEIFVLMGLSGCGKSTLLRCINGLIQPTEGEIFVDEENISELGEDELVRLRREKLGMVFQSFALFPHRNVLDNVAYGLEVQGVEEQKRIEKARDMLELVGLEGWGESSPQDLSGGMQQRVGLARALALEPEILLMDEPFSALDPLIREEMQDELLLLKRELAEITIVFVTHDLDEAAKLGERIAILNPNGEIEQLDTPERILKEPATDYVEAFARGVDRSKVLQAETVMSEPELVIGSDWSPKKAEKTLREAGLKSCLVTDGHNRRIKGEFSLDRLKEINLEAETIGECGLKEIKSIEPELPMREFWNYLGRGERKVIVVDDNKELLGIIKPENVIEALSAADAEGRDE